MYSLSNIKKGSFLLYSKSCLLVKKTKVSFIHKSWNSGLTLILKVCKLVSSYRSPSQNQEQFIVDYKVVYNVELNLDYHWKINLFMISVIVNFNSKLKSLYKNCNTSIRDQKFNVWLIFLDLYEIKNYPDAPFSLHRKWLYQIMYANSNLSICYPPPF